MSDFDERTNEFDETGKNMNRVAGGFKATINNPNMSDDTKERAQEKLEELEKGNIDVVEDRVNDTNQTLGGYKATLSNPNTSEAAKAKAAAILDGEPEENTL